MSQTVNPKVKGAQVGKGLTIERVFSTAGTHPYDELTWERRDVVQQTGRPARRSSSSAAWSSPTSGASTPPRS